MSAEGPLRDGRGPAFELIETMRWEPGKGVALRALHLDRLTGSAAELGFAFHPEAFQKKLAAISATTDQRVRMALASNGALAMTREDFALQRSDTIWTLRLAGTRLNSADPQLRHKTSARDVYAAARAEYTVSEAAEVILLNERDEICEGTITNVFVERDGLLLTPPLSCGLLAGVLRQHLLETGRAREAILTREDLLHAGNVFVGNALRGLIRGRLLF
ncbi:MAG TPA: aminotransferase class IV family protein [Rhizobiaceae bacterium]|nr:aminotransferase class IV family protein [Rhizobiaceae bacterium]